MIELPTQADIDLCIALNIPDCNAPIVAAHRIAATRKHARDALAKAVQS